MVQLSCAALALLPLFPSVFAFSPQSLPQSQVYQPSPYPRSRYIQPTSTKLGVGAEFDEFDDEVILGEECNISPEGYGFSASMGRILAAADRDNGFYRATASELVTSVMEGMTSGKADVALVFEDSSDKLLGIFTETDYVKVRLLFVRLPHWVVLNYDLHILQLAIYRFWK
jgi:hypothetical protein